MINKLQSIISALIGSEKGEEGFHISNVSGSLKDEVDDDADIAQALNAAFLIALSGETHPEFPRAEFYLNRMARLPEWTEVAHFYMQGKQLVYDEIESVAKHDLDFAGRLDSLAKWITNPSDAKNPQETTERIWSLFFPEASGILAHRENRINALRAKRTVRITERNPSPIIDPGREILFTSNVLLTIPPLGRQSLNDLPLSPRLKERLSEIVDEPQVHFYDHPIQLGVDPKRNEVFYGIRGLEEAFEFERARGNLSQSVRPTCVLSVSTTHQGLQSVARAWLEEEFAGSEARVNMDIYLFTETDTQVVIRDILVPAARHYFGYQDAEKHLRVLGVDGEYGRHYSFLKAIAPFWSVLIQPEFRATFKIDLDQVFPQQELVKETGASAFEHFRTPLWGAKGLGSDGQPLELSMIAGALVNEHDIEKSLFTPDVTFPNRELSPDEYIFYSPLPQALSTEAEMMTRYSEQPLDGKKACLQRIHVSGGTTGVLVESIRRYRPFTPSFIGRAEDQAYILSVLRRPGRRLAYLHQDGLIMRHDKTTFAQEAIKFAYLGKILGDYVRILYFSAYSNALTDDLKELKQLLDPFTGCFISKIPLTVTLLRFALRAASFYSQGEEGQGTEFIRKGSRRITDAIDFAKGNDSALAGVLENERLGWNLYYDTLSAIEAGLGKGEAFALDLRQRAQHIIGQCLIRS